MKASKIRDAFRPVREKFEESQGIFWKNLFIFPSKRLNCSRNNCSGLNLYCVSNFLKEFGTKPTVRTESNLSKAL